MRRRASLAQEVEMTKWRIWVWLVAGTVTLSFLTALAILVSTASEPESGSARPIVLLPPVAAITPAAPPARPEHGTVPPVLPSLPDARIASTLEDPGATFRTIRAADGTNNIVCGEVRGSGRSYYRRFVWIAEAQLLATDDGGPHFAHVAKLCDGGIDLATAQHRSEP